MVIYNNPHPANVSHHLQSVNGTLKSTATATGDVWLLYVSDYNMGQAYAKIHPSQGGFSVFKPNLTIYRDIQRIVLKGNYDLVDGWKHPSGVSTGIFWGAATFQGLLPYYFQIVHPGHALELDWCVHNNMNSPNGEKLRRNGETIDYCYVPDCQDCRDYSIRDVYSVHFTNCQKPWKCEMHGGVNPKLSLCRGMHQKWFEYRSELEMTWGRSGRGSNTNGTLNPILRGYCSHYGDSGYEPIRQPYGPATRQQPQLQVE
jgi:hypothetical protein